MSFFLVASITTILLLGATLYLFQTKKKNSTAPPKVQSKETEGARKGEGAPRTSLINLSDVDQTLYENLQHAVKNYPNRPCYGVRPLIKVVKEEKTVHGEKKVFDYFELGPYQKFTFKEVQQRVETVACAFNSIGLKSGDIFGIYADTSIEWSLVAHASFRQSITIATVYTTLGEEAVEFALRDTKLNYVFTNGRLLGTVVNCAKQNPNITCIVYCGDANPKAEEELKNRKIKLISFDELEKLGSGKQVEAVPPKPTDVAMIMYTSGSTGNPKGVMLRHLSLTSAASAVILGTNYKITEEDVYISYLPLAHVLAFVAETAMIKWGVYTGYANPRSLADSSVRNCKGDLNELQPTLMAGVPTIYDRLKRDILSKIEKQNIVLKSLFKAAFYFKSQTIKYNLDTPILNKLIFDKIKSQAGGRLRVMLSGGAPISSETLTFLRVCFSCAAIQGYGLTETGGGSTVQNVGDNAVAGAGPPVPGTIMKLVDVPDMKYSSNDSPPRGEIWITGESLATGYFNSPELTQKDFQDGWFRTGDVGEWTPEGTLKVIDRIKNLVKLSHGEYIALESVESKVKKSEYVDNMCLYGDGEKPHLVALVVPRKEKLEEWAKQNGLGGKSWKDVCGDKNARAEVLKSLVAAGKASNLKSNELPKAVFLCHEEWTPENEMLSASMKLKRPAINKAFKKEIEELYKNSNDD